VDSLVKPTENQPKDQKISGHKIEIHPKHHKLVVRDLKTGQQTLRPKIEVLAYSLRQITDYVGEPVNRRK
jgi:hypothetical protein